MALAAVGLAEPAATTFSTPIFVTSLAMVFLRERIGLQCWLAVFVGLFGVLVVDALRPGRLRAGGAARALRRNSPKSSHMNAK